jgi:hypothetical protein
MKMRFYLKIISVLSLILLSGCNSNIYKEQLIKYQNTIGNKFIYYLNNDPNISINDRNMYLQINYETTELLSK